MPGTLFVVATPIGNLEDVTLRALRVLREVALIAAEDTRRTSRLLQHYSISTRTTSLHAHNEHKKARQLVERLQQGASIALVSDAGTPVVSDPGQQLVHLAREAGIRVEAIPGPSAVMAAISIAGEPADRFLFAGLPPSRSKDRKKWLQRLLDGRQLLVFFEAPHRIVNLLGLIAETAPVCSVGIARELTKTHEELVIKPIIEWLEGPPVERGEFTVLVFPFAGGASDEERAARAIDVTVELDQMTENGRTVTRAQLKELSRKTGLPVNQLYAQAHAHRK